MQLADSRATQIRDFLVTGQGVVPERVEILEREEHEEEKGDWARCRLALDGSS